MNKPNLAKFAKDVRMVLSKHSPEILTGLGIAGMVTSTVLAVRATPKALMLIEDARYDKGEDLTPVETVKAAWKPYVPAAATGIVSIACLVSASSVNYRRNAALATAYKLSETAFSEYKEKVIETIGEKKEKTVRDKVDKDTVENNPVSKTEVIITEKGNTLFLDTISRRYFMSDLEKIGRAENEINHRMLLDMYVSLNVFYDELGLDHTSIGYDLGWTLDKGYLKIDIGSQVTDDGRPCIVLNYNIAPEYDFSKLV